MHWGLPFLALNFLVSDIYDLFVIWNNSIYSLAFNSSKFVILVYTRIFIDVILLIIITLLSLRAYNLYKNMQEKLLEFIPLKYRNEFNPKKQVKKIKSI